MAQDREAFFRTQLIDQNKEFDYLDQTLTDYEPSKTVLWRVPSWAVNRLDLVSYLHYRTPDLWWLIAFHNNIENPYTDVIIGLELYIPNISEYYSFYNVNSLLDEIPDQGFDTREIE